jgi:chorismate mutase
MKNKASIIDLREKIDKIDNQIFILLSKRFSIVHQIFNIKKEKGISISNPTREKKITNKMIRRHKKINSDFIHKIYSVIFNYSKKIISTRGEDK